MAKHAQVYPSTSDLEAVQTIISHVECSLKTISDMLDDVKVEVKEEKETSEAEER